MANTTPIENTISALLSIFRNLSVSIFNLRAIIPSNKSDKTPSKPKTKITSLENSKFINPIIGKKKQVKI
tara:strand:- start:865 stop:1074 length:210 start_codon:yes stop_codon:yes gene_type:complete